MQPTIKAGVSVECPACHTKNDAILYLDICKVEKTGARKCIECGQVFYYDVQIICTIKKTINLMDMLVEVNSENDLPY